MDWHRLLSTKRTGQEDLPIVDRHDRTQFQRDYDRLIFSSPFRRLQDKTQVFPLPGSVFVHNRLTHSLEVASVGRSLGNNLARELGLAGEGPAGLVDEIGSIVAAACLAHDMGNPPFGHSGEEAIAHYFKHGEGQKYEALVTPEQWSDLIRFEGNANALRILTHAFNGRRKGGFALTYSTVAAVVKYPYASSVKDLKKYGFFQSEQFTYEAIAQELDIKCLDTQRGIYARHPLVYLVEAADDICYQVMDIEDAHKLHILSYEETVELLTGFFSRDDEAEEFRRIDEVFAEVTDLNERITYLRAKVIGKLVNCCSAIFWDNRQAILGGAFAGCLIDYLPAHESAAMDVCKKTALKRIYKHPSVVEIEIAGFKILGTLMHEFVQALHNPSQYYSRLLLPFIPEQFRVDENASTYDKLLSVVDLVSGMTDVYALDLYRKINGMGLGSKK
ncbi:MAG: dNTP triphosphohydrolase [Breznakibacter sp.]|nr:dNTP triphosphohydrolase [Breznakibacter sp.]